MENPFATMSVLNKFVHLKHIHFSKKLQKIDPVLRKPQAGIIIHMSPIKAYRVGELAKMLEVTPGAITHSAKPLIKKGYLMRENGEDLRTVYLKLTEKGIKLREKVINSLEEMNNKMLNFLNKEEQKQLIALLSKITENLEKGVLEDE